MIEKEKDLKETFSTLIQSKLDKLDNLDYLIKLKEEEVELMKEHLKCLVQYLIKNKIK